MNGEAPLLKSLGEIGGVQLVTKVEAVDYGKVIMTIWSRVRSHSQFT